MSLSLPTKRKDITFRKDTNVTVKPTMAVRKDAIVPIPPQIRFSNAFPTTASYSAASIHEFCRNIMYNWFPATNYTNTPVSGSLQINGNNVGNLEMIVVPGQSVTSANQANWFSATKDTASSFIFVKGNLGIDAGVTLAPSPIARKLFTVVYVAGNLTFGDANSSISMTQRGANHSGGGTSGGATTEVGIQVGPSTAIAANGADGAAGPNTVEQAARRGLDGSTTQSALQTGGGGGGWWDYYTAP